MSIRIKSRVELNYSINKDEEEINYYNDEISSKINKVDVQKDIKDLS